MLSNSENVMLIAIVPHTLKDDVVDTLIKVPFTSGFSLFKIQGFSKEHSQFNISEQVVGYQNFYRFEVAHSPTDTHALLNHLKGVTQQQVIRFWVVPVLEAGVL